MSEFQDWLDKKEARRSRKRAGLTRSRMISHSTIKKKPRKPKPGFSEEVRQAAHDRNGNQCENPLCGKRLPGLGGEHHCLPRSQYKKPDRNEVWNCAAICQDCHFHITFPKEVESKRLGRYFEHVAVARRSLQGEELTEKLLELEKSLKNQSLDLIRPFWPFTK